MREIRDSKSRGRQENPRWLWYYCSYNIDRHFRYIFAGISGFKRYFILVMKSSTLTASIRNQSKRSLQIWFGHVVELATVNRFKIKFFQVRENMLNVSTKTANITRFYRIAITISKWKIEKVQSQSENIILTLLMVHPVNILSKDRFFSSIRDSADFA